MGHGSVFLVIAFLLVGWQCLPINASGAPDPSNNLVVDDFIEFSSRPRSGEEVKATVKVFNAGTEEVRGISARLYHKDKLLSEEIIAVIPPGSYSSVEFEFRSPFMRISDYDVTAKVNEDHELLETHYGDNSISQKVDPKIGFDFLSMFFLIVILAISAPTIWRWRIRRSSDRSIRTFRSELKRMETTGILSSKYSREIDIARSYHDKRRYKDAMEVMENLRARYSQDLKNHKDASETILKMKDSLIYIKNYSSITLSHSNQVFGEALEAMERNDYDEVIRLCQLIAENVQEGSENSYEYEERVSEYQTIMASTNAQGTEVAEARSALGSAALHLEDGNYIEAGKELQQVQMLVRPIIEWRDTVHSELDRACGLVSIADEAGIDISEARPHLNAAQEAIETYEFQDGAKCAREAISLAEARIHQAAPTVNVFFEGRVRPNAWNKVKMAVKNTGLAHAKDVQVQVSGACEVKRIEPIDYLQRGEERSQEVALMCEKEGSLPVDVRVVMRRAQDDLEVTSNHMAWIESGLSVSKKRDSTPLGSSSGGDVTIFRETEYFQGFVRLKVAVQNKTGGVMTHVILKLVFNESALRLDSVEPDGYPIRHTDIELGIINPGEKVTIAAYLDPQICTSSFVDASLIYHDSSGFIRTALMDRKKVDVACPVFFTEDSANTAMIKNLVSNVLDNQDSKLFTIPDSVGAQMAFGICKELVQKRDVRFVREFVRNDPLTSEAWYYGVTKVMKEQLVIKTSVREDTNTIELFVASAGKLALTGLLAELGNHLQESFKAKGQSALPQQVTNVVIKDSIINRSSLLFSSDTRISIEGSVVNRGDLDR